MLRQAASSEIAMGHGSEFRERTWHLGHFGLEVRGEVIFQGEDDGVGGGHEGVLLDGVQALVQLHGRRPCPARRQSSEEEIVACVLGQILLGQVLSTCREGPRPRPWWRWARGRAR